jgi:hypothetical protein
MDPASQPEHQVWPSPRWLLAALGLTGVLLAIVLVVPRLLYPPLSDRELDRDKVTGKDRIQLQNDRLKLQNDARATLLQGLAGGVLLLGAYFTWRQVQSTRRQLSIAEQGQLTERFTRAVDQLGSDRLDLRLGGIYALERIARDSPLDRATIGEVLTAYIRQRSPWPPSQPGQYQPDWPLYGPHGQPELRARALDLQATLTVLGRGPFPKPSNPQAGLAARLDLHQVDLRRADLIDANLQGANLREAHLEGAVLRGANLQAAILSQADLEGAFLADAHLEGAVLTAADLTGARLERASLNGAHLEGADLWEAELGSTELRGGHADDRTRWPSAWNRQRAQTAGVDFPAGEAEGI